MSDAASATNELTFTCILDAPRELVFRCMMEPEHLTHFWGPIGTSAPLDKITIDPRPGGVFEATTSDFIDLGDARTEVRIRQTDIPAMFKSEDAKAGFKSSLDRFAVYLTTI